MGSGISLRSWPNRWSPCSSCRRRNPTCPRSVRRRAKRSSRSSRPPGVLRVEDVVRSEGAVAVTYGAGGDVEAYGRNVYVKTRLVIAAAAYGIEAIDRVYFDLEDDEGFRTEALEAKRLGYVGKQVVHPTQVCLANEIFSPTEEEIRWAKEVVRAYEEAARQGRGAIRVRDRLVDAVHYRGAKKTLERAGL